MNLLEQIKEVKSLIESVNETLTHADEMEAWELKEYNSVKLEYVDRLTELESNLDNYYKTFPNEKAN